MGFIRAWVLPVFRFLCIASIGQGILLWLESMGVRPAAWVPRMIEGMASVSPDALWWLLVGLFGLSGSLLWVPIAKAVQRSPLMADKSGPDSLQRMPLIELRDEAARQGWDMGPQSLHILDLADAAQQAGLDETLRFWGRPDRNIFKSLTRNERLVEIPRDHWRDFDINAYLQNATDNFDVSTYTLRHEGEHGFRDIHVERAPALRWLKSEALSFRGRRQTGKSSRQVSQP